MATGSRIVPVILSGGTGSRLWPLSREALPKQLLSLAGEASLLQQTALRAADTMRFTAPITVAGEAHGAAVRAHLDAVGMGGGAVVMEPSRRGTAPAAAAAALIALERDPDAMLLIMPADHVVEDPAAFLRALDAGEAAARAGRLVLFGVRPSRPATGYGYIRTGQALGQGLLAMSAFVEKPDLATATSWLAAGNHLWNSGIFLMAARAFLDELEQFEPEVAAAAREAVGRARVDQPFVYLDAAAFARAPAISIDHAVMERTENAAVVPADFGWADIGTWSALWEAGPRDASGNVLAGNAYSEASSNSYIRGDGVPVVALGVRDLIVVAAGGAVLVADKAADQDVRRVADLVRGQMAEAWGECRTVEVGDGAEIRRLTVLPGASLPPRRHADAVEHWIVASGRARMTLDGSEREIAAGEALLVPQGVEHVVSNAGDEPLRLVRVRVPSR